MPIVIRPLETSDVPDWLAMRRELGPEWVVDRVDAFARTYFESGRIDGLEHIVLIAREDATGVPVGFAEVSLRDYAEGCSSNPVGYLEGWFIADQARGRGGGRALLEAGEAWARARGCVEFASDAETTNPDGIAAHGALGFTEVCRIVCFRKSLR
jgi:aminoglycoside 6'-N-acetyltransferase I